MKFLKKISIIILRNTLGIIINILPPRFVGVLLDSLIFIRVNQYNVFYRIFGDLSAIRFTKAYNAEPLMLEFINNMNKNDCFWDVGACIGTFSCLTVSRDIETVCFEANPYNIYALYENIKLNSSKKNRLKTFIYPIAVSENFELIKLPENESMGNAIEVNNFDDNSLYLESVGLPIDVVIKEQKIRQPTHIKIDVDGNEISVLRSLHTILGQDTTRNIHIEISKNETEITLILQKYGFDKVKCMGENYIFKK